VRRGGATDPRHLFEVDLVSLAAGRADRTRADSKSRPRWRHEQPGGPRGNQGHCPHWPEVPGPPLVWRFQVPQLLACPRAAVVRAAAVQVIPRGSAGAAEPRCPRCCATGSDHTDWTLAREIAERPSLSEALRDAGKGSELNHGVRLDEALPPASPETSVRLVMVALPFQSTADVLGDVGSITSNRDRGQEDGKSNSSRTPGPSRALSQSR
jgi:hypothetical protein